MATSSDPQFPSRVTLAFDRACNRQNTQFVKIKHQDLNQYPKLVEAIELLGIDLSPDIKLAFDQQDSAGSYLHATKSIRLYEDALSDIQKFPDFVKGNLNSDDYEKVVYAAATLLHENTHRLQFANNLNEVWLTGSNGPFLQYALVNCIAEVHAECTVMEYFYNLETTKKNVIINGFGLAAASHPIFKNLWLFYRETRLTKNAISARKAVFQYWLDDVGIRQAFMPSMVKYLFLNYPVRQSYFRSLSLINVKDSPLQYYLDWFGFNEQDVSVIFDKIVRMFKHWLINGKPFGEQKSILRRFPKEGLSGNGFMICSSKLPSSSTKPLIVGSKLIFHVDSLHGCIRH